MKGLIALTILLFLPLVQSVTPLQKEDKTHTADHQSDAQDKKASLENEPLNGQGKPLQSTTREECKCSNQNPPDYKTAGFWVNVVLAIGTIIIAIFSVVMGSAARKSANVAANTLRFLAADIHIESAGLIPAGPITPNSYVALKIKNFGGSRAEKVRSFVVVTIPGVPNSELSPEEFTIPPQGTQNIRFLEFIEFLNKDTFQQIVDGAIVVKFSGKITYVDLFGDIHTLDVKESVLEPSRGAFTIGKYPAGQTK
jgi:hypothetical protein